MSSLADQLSVTFFHDPHWLLPAHLGRVFAMARLSARKSARIFWREQMTRVVTFSGAIYDRLATTLRCLPGDAGALIYTLYE